MTAKGRPWTVKLLLFFGHKLRVKQCHHQLSPCGKRTTWDLGVIGKTQPRIVRHYISIPEEQVWGAIIQIKMLCISARCIEKPKTFSVDTPYSIIGI